ncbi:unnamed protein product, partial [Phaeothamnion confervicola]
RLVFDVKRVLERWGIRNAHAISRAKVPVVKVTDPNGGPDGGTACYDICINHSVAIHNTRLLRCYVEFDERCRGMLYLVKAWAKARDVSASDRGFLSSYGWALLAIHFLQRVGVAPNL